MPYDYYIDASTTRMGIVLEDQDKKELIVTDLDFSHFHADKNQSHMRKQVNKFRFIEQMLDRFVQKWLVGDRVVIEGIFLNPVYKNSSEVLLKLHGFLIHYFLDKDLIFLPPAHIKKIITGKGNASKKLVAKGIKEVTQQKIEFKNNDQSDAFAIFLTYKKEYENKELIDLLNGYMICIL